MPSFVIQKHEKTPEDLHYDFMLEKEGVLETWSFPGSPVDEPILEGEKIFDHRLKYLTFEGEIGRGLGRVEIFDRGIYRPVIWEEGRIEIFLEGGKISGPYLLLWIQGDLWTLKKFETSLNFFGYKGE